jgi:creatinase
VRPREQGPDHDDLPPRAFPVPQRRPRRTALPFADEEYHDRLAGLREIMALHGLDAAVLTSMHNIAYYSGFLYCSFGRPYAPAWSRKPIASPSAPASTPASPGGGHADNITYTDWSATISGARWPRSPAPARQIGCEADHLTMERAEKLNVFLQAEARHGHRAGHDGTADAEIRGRDRADQARRQRGRRGRLCDPRRGKGEGATELEVAMAGRDAMEREIAKRFPDAEYRDTWVWFQSGMNTDGAHNPVTNRKLKRGDILSLNCFPMISGYYTALERTMFVGEVDDASLRVWETNIAAMNTG